MHRVTRENYETFKEELLELKERYSNLKISRFFERWNEPKAVKKPKRKRGGAISGERVDLGNLFLRSRLEADFARVLETLFPGSWDYESTKVVLEETRERGIKTYLLDFTLRKGEIPELIHFEMKGRFFPGDKTKIKRFSELTEGRYVLVAPESSKEIFTFCAKNRIDVCNLTRLVELCKTLRPDLSWGDREGEKGLRKEPQIDATQAYAALERAITPAERNPTSPERSTNGASPSATKRRRKRDET